MRRGAFLGLLLWAAALVAAVQLAGAQVVERIQIADPTRAAHGLPPGLVVELSSPAEYNRETSTGTAGSWIGPRFVARNGQSSGDSSIDWTVTFDERQGDAEQIAFAHLRRGWARDQRGGLSVPRVFGNRVIGTILGYYHLHGFGGTDARFEAVLAFPLEANLHAVVRLELLDPPSDAFVVRDVTASTWNRGQALLALSGVRLHGNLPPKIVSARTFERGRLVRGRVIDRFLDPVVGATVTLERSRGGGWVRAARSRSTSRGTYSFRAGPRAIYRVTATMSGFRAESRRLRAGRG
jgi:Carboxypeptidase regulatory-like domain